MGMCIISGTIVLSRILTMFCSLDGSFVRWSDELYKHVLQYYPTLDGQDPIPDDVILPARWSLEPALQVLNDKPVSSPDTIDDAAPPPANLLPIPEGYTATLATSKRMTPDTHWQDVRLFSFDIESPDPLQCHPGDCLTIYPKNFPKDAQRLIELMNWGPIADQPLDLSLCPSLPKSLFSSPNCTLRQLLLNNIDITAIPRRSFLKNMSYFSTDPYHKERLLEFSMPDYIDEYFDYATRSRRTIIEVLDEFTSVQIPASRILDIFPLIRGRDFSIANGAPQPPTPDKATTAKRIDLLAAMVRYKTILRKPREGLCSRYLDSLQPGSQLTVSRKAVLSPIHGPDNAKRPLIAMATGTGLAPVRFLIHERLTHPDTGPMILFFGNRNKSSDYFFEDEWKDLQTAACPLTVHTAFSRDQREKIYVQDLIRQQSEQLATLLVQNPIFTVCGGSSKMADACKRAVFDPFLESGRTQGDDVEAARKVILDNVTWWQEIW